MSVLIIAALVIWGLCLFRVPWLLGSAGIGLLDGDGISGTGVWGF